MAVLSKNGFELARITKTVDLRERELRAFESDDSRLLEETTSISVRSNRHILKRHSGKFADRYRSNGIRPHDWGWKQWRKWNGPNDDAFRAFVARYCDKFESAGWTVERKF